MPSTIILVKDDERLPLYFGEKGSVDTAIIWYRRLPSKKRREIIDANTIMGATNWFKCGLEFAKYAIVGWENIIDPSGVMIPYHLDLVDALPEEVVTEVIGKLTEAAPASFFSS
jgi:hypothetical protein